MTTLDANRTQLSQLQRSKAVADALTQQAMQMRQIQHPYQGMAQLAQALAGGLLNIRNSKAEKRLMEERREAMIEALGPQYQDVGVSTQAMQSPVEQPSLIPGQLPSSPIPQQEVNQVARMQTSAGLSPELVSRIMTLPPELQEQLIAKWTLHELTPDPETTRPRDAVSFAQRNQDGTLHDYRAAVPGTQTFNDLVKDPRYLRVQNPKDVERTVDWGKFGKDSRMFEYQDMEAGYKQSVGVLDQMFADVQRAGNAALNFTGSISTGINTLLSQAKALAETATYSLRGRGAAWDGDRLTAIVNGRVVNEGSPVAETGLFDPELYDIDVSKITQNAIEAQRIKTQAISLAYAMARADDPGGRLSEKDVELQLQKLGLQQGDYLVTLAALATTRQILDRNIAISASSMSRGSASADLVPVPQAMQGFYDGNYSPIAPTFELNGKIVAEGQRIVDNETGEIYEIRDGQPVPTGERLP